jgi:GNAT superfamily N-acetyltransferase
MSPSVLSLQRVVSDADRRAFLSFPHQLYREDPNWIPRLWPEQMDWLCRRNPFFEQGDGDWFMARRNDQVVGTIGVAMDHSANRVQGRKWGIFGFLEFVEEEQVFRALIERAKEYLRLRGATHMVGPRSFGESDFPGLLVGRYDCPAALMEGHTPPYYLAMAESAGWTEGSDTLAYRWEARNAGENLELLPAKLRHVAERVARNPRCGLRPAQLSEFDRDLDIVRRIYNRALGTLPGFTPMEEDELRRFADDLRSILVEELIWFALVDGQEVGFSLAVPNAAEAFRKCGGLRHPWQYLELALALRRIRSVSFKILAVDPDYWGMGLEALMFWRVGEVALRRGYRWLDGSLTGADNPQTNKISLRLGAEEYKRYRVFTVPL